MIHNLRFTNTKRTMKTKLKLAALALLLSTLNPQLSTLNAQGSLAPPGAPAPTMKTLDQIEARTPIDAAHTPGDGANQFIITNSGSYYLTGNIIGVSGKNGISINANNVTLDLKGFALIGVAGTLSGIIVPAAQRNLRVYNGSVDYWYAAGLSCDLCSNSQFDHLRVSQNNGNGLSCGNGSVLNGCSAETNGLRGILTGDRGTLTGCIASNNHTDGIYTGSGCAMTACASTGNGRNGTYAGINIQDDCTVTACSANHNIGIGIYPGQGCTITDCTANRNGIDGIRAGTEGKVVNCIANFNSGNGITCYGDCFITGNVVCFNGNGVETTGSPNRIDGNTANHNSQVGILWVNDVVIRNSAFLNTSANYSPAVGTGNTGPLNAAGNSTSPWANF